MSVRSRSRMLAMLVALAMPAVMIMPLVASGEPSKKPGAGRSDKGDQDPNDKYDPDNITGISQYMETVVKGMERFTAKDYTTAIDTFKRAVALSPKSALAYYALTEAYLQQGNIGEAEAAVTQALEGNVDTAKNPQLRARVLFIAAEVYERKKDREKAKAAWQAYLDFASKNADAGFPQTGTERIKVMQKVIEMDKAYVVVRERIAAEKEKDAGKPATPAKK